MRGRFCGCESFLYRSPVIEMQADLVLRTAFWCYTPSLLAGCFSYLGRITPVVVVREAEQTLPCEVVGVLGEFPAALGLYFQKFRLDDRHARDNRGQRLAFRKPVVSNCAA